MNRRLCRYVASGLAVLAIGCEGQSPSPPPAPAPGPAATAPASKRPARGDTPTLGPSLTPLKD
ncbi:MAG TPA: hypothetical protein VGH33_02590 [Isosphaeraceae bacterium]|jgi:hypothetical protein